MFTSDTELQRRDRTMMQQNQSHVSLDQTDFMDLMPKRLKTDVPLSPKEKKDKFSQRISALQQLVSPYGKTDTASVLLEAMEYIRFLHDQVQVLSAPYLYSAPMPQMMQDDEQCSLKAKGLCLVPVSLTIGVASSNGADIWAPMKSNLPNSRRTTSDES